MSRELIVVDVETTGLNYTIHKIIEVAAINTATDEVVAFCPHVDPLDLGNADGFALQVNRYYERGAWKHMLTTEASNEQYRRLAEMLKGNTLAGCNPTFDSEFLTQASQHLYAPVWHYRLADLSAYAAGALGIPPNELGGLGDICERLGVDPGIEHSALDDARATVECFRKLSGLRGGVK